MMMKRSARVFVDGGGECGVVWCGVVVAGFLPEERTRRIRSATVIVVRSTGPLVDLFCFRRRFAPRCWPMREANDITTLLGRLL